MRAIIIFPIGYNFHHLTPIGPLCSAREKKLRPPGAAGLLPRKIDVNKTDTLLSCMYRTMFFILYTKFQSARGRHLQYVNKNKVRSRYNSEWRMRVLSCICNVRSFFIHTFIVRMNGVTMFTILCQMFPCATHPNGNLPQQPARIFCGPGHRRLGCHLDINKSKLSSRYLFS